MLCYTNGLLEQTVATGNAGNALHSMSMLSMTACIEKVPRLMSASGDTEVDSWLSSFGELSASSELKLSHGFKASYAVSCVALVTFMHDGFMKKTVSW